ncbi:MAG: 50S ribosome-binding GTPase [Deltaproteobacteria bacterium]|nr:50S ribosome-binding GTPase [Deltaproteobacteria bacterium]
MKKSLVIALAGNPNCGKSCIFNNLTGARQHVGNWPGVTVEKKEGICKYGDYEIRVVDLPGTYSLTAYSIDETIARNFVMEEKPDVVVNIVDASNLERNLYLTTQFVEIEAPLILCLNMIDLAESRGHKIDIKQLSEFLGTLVIPTVGHRNQGTDKLLEAIVSLTSHRDRTRRKMIKYGKEMEEEITKLEALIKNDEQLNQTYPSRWLAVKLLEGDEEVMKKLEG